MQQEPPGSGFTAPVPVQALSDSEERLGWCAKSSPSPGRIRPRRRPPSASRTRIAQYRSSPGPSPSETRGRLLAGLATGDLRGQAVSSLPRPARACRIPGPGPGVHLRIAARGHPRTPTLLLQTDASLPPEFPSFQSYLSGSGRLGPSPSARLQSAPARARRRHGRLAGVSVAVRAAGAGRDGRTRSQLPAAIAATVMGGAARGWAQAPGPAAPCALPRGPISRGAGAIAWAAGGATKLLG